MEEVPASPVLSGLISRGLIHGAAVPLLCGNTLMGILLMCTAGNSAQSLELLSNTSLQLIASGLSLAFFSQSPNLPKCTCSALLGIANSGSITGLASVVCQVVQRFIATQLHVNLSCVLAMTGGGSAGSGAVGVLLPEASLQGSGQQGSSETPRVAPALSAANRYVLAWQPLRNTRY